MSAKNYTCRVEGGNQHVTGAFINEGTLTINYSDGRVRTFNASTLGRTGSY